MTQSTIARAIAARWRWLLAGLLLAALLMRLHGIGFGLPALNDPDELMFELGAIRMMRTLSLDPGWFGHPATTTMELLTLINAGVFGVGHVAGWFGSPREFIQAIYLSPDWIIVPGRVAMALFGIGTIAMVWRLANSLFGRAEAFAAAAMLAVDPVHITYSQIIRSDMMACFFMLMCMNSALRIARAGRWRDYVWASLWLGLAIATKWPFGLSGLAVAGAVALRLRDHPEERRAALNRFGLCMAMALVCLFLVSPYLLIDHATVWRDVTGEARTQHLGATGGTPLENAWWYVRGPLLAGVGAVGMLWLIGGIVLSARRREVLAIIAPLTTVFFLLICSQHLVWERWALPLMPLAALLAAPVVIGLCRWCLKRLPLLPAIAAVVALLLGTLLPPAVAALTLANERTNDTRQRASRWAVAHVPPGSKVFVEQFAFDLLRYPWHLLFPLGDAGCVDARAGLVGEISYAPIGAARGDRSIVDYGTVAAERRDTCRADYAIISQYDRYRVQKSAFPHAYAAYRSLMAEGQEVAVFAPIPGISGGPTVRIIKLGPRPASQF